MAREDYDPLAPKEYDPRLAAKNAAWIKESGFVVPTTQEEADAQWQAKLAAHSKSNWIDKTLKYAPAVMLGGAALQAGLAGAGAASAGTTGATTAGTAATGTAAAGAEGLSLAGTYGGAGSLGSSSLLTGGTLGTTATTTGAAGYGGLGITAAGGGTAALGTIAPGAAGSESLAATGTATAPTASAATPTLSSVPAGASPMSGLSASDWIGLGGLAMSVINKPDAPDTSGINAAAQSNAAIAGRQQDLAEKQYADQMALFNEWKPMLTQQLQSSITAQQASTARSDQQWADYLKTWQPVEQQLAQKSLDYASPGRQAQAAQEAAGGVAAQYDTARSSGREDMIRAGLDPSAITSLESSGRLLEAKDKAGAANTARRTVESQGLAYLDNAAKFGRNMTSTGLAAAGLAGQQGGQVQSGYSSLVNATGAPAASASPLFQSAVSANNSSGSLYGNAAGMDAEGSINNSNYWLGTLGGVGKLYGMAGGFTSSKKAKHIGKKVDTGKAGDDVEDAKVVRWSYKDGHGDGNTKDRMGPTAEDLHRVSPEVSDGKSVDAISMLGLHHAAVGGHNKKLRDQDKRLARLEKRIGLAAA